ncbi:hypothetical protein MKW98_018651 [Papaver atlanticum]|uniref:3-beta hydroxysteroid dehydrogenase/isomerase domain-containing protein n=1 Tax=Papaver atlanticum TaxID=357466 RepID=A0AAD4T5K5_9MAGN|nr:hypothetical protein MKW98_018651 [Papaver atlanticum]
MNNRLEKEEMVGIKGNKFFVIGGLGFVGSALCSELIRRGASDVRIFDFLASPTNTCSSESDCYDDLKRIGVRIIQGDVRQKTDVGRALREGADCVFHLASYGASGKEMLQVERVEEVNINGTCHVADACLEYGIKRLVYMSTNSVVGKEIVNGNEENSTYLPMDDYHYDPYGRSKSAAEQLVLKSNGLVSQNGNTRLYTCAIRPGIIYGPGDQGCDLLPRVVSVSKLGLLKCKIVKAPNSHEAKTDWVYLDNLVHALILGSMGLVRNLGGGGGREEHDYNDPVAAGKTYFISDGCPVNTFEFTRPLLRSLDHDLPKYTLDLSYALLFGRIFWALYRTLLYPWLDHSWLPQPLILPADAYKVGVTHYFSIQKAEEELGYVPHVTPQEGMSKTISYWQERKNRELDGPTIYPWIFCLIGIPWLFGAAFLPNVGPVKPFKTISLFFYRSLRNAQIGFVIVTLVHICEAMYAWYLAKKVDPSNANGWFWQTLILATFSLRFLLRRARNKKITK